MPEPEVELYDDEQYRASQAASARRLALARNRARKLRRTRNLAIGALAVGVPLLLVAGVVAARAPASPYLVVTWPKSKEPQVLAPAQTVLTRGGQPFEVAITDAQKWDVTWKSGGAEQQGGAFSWAPAEGNGQLTAVCKPLAKGWQNYFKWLWPTREVKLSALAPVSKGNYARQINTPREGMWIYPHIFAAGNIAWDERALPMISDAADALAAPALERKLAPLRNEPTENLWVLVGDFDGESKTPNPDATFASLHADDLENSLPQIAAHVVKNSPEASVKFVLRLDSDPQKGIIRLAFDGKKERAAWVRRAGDSKGQPLKGWEGN